MIIKKPEVIRNTILGMIPLEVWLLVGSILITALFVEAGEQLAEEVVSLVGSRSDMLRADVRIILLLLNLFVLVIFSHIILTRTGYRRDDIYSKLINYLTIPVVVVFLYRELHGNPSHFYYIWFGLIVVFYLIFLPLIIFGSKEQEIQKQKKEEALRQHFRILLRNSAYILSVSMITLVLTTALFVIANNTFVRGVGISNLQGFWVINPAILALGVLQVSTMEVTKWELEHMIIVAITQERLIHFLILSSILLIAVIAIYIIHDDNLLSPIQCQPNNQCPHHYSQPTSIFQDIKIGAKVLLSLIYFGAFYIAFYISKGAKRKYSSIGRMICCLIFFGIAGMLVGLSIVGVRKLTSVDFGYFNFHLVWMHALGFVLACVGIWLGDRFLSTRFKGTQPIMSA